MDGACARSSTSPRAPAGVPGAFKRNPGIRLEVSAAAGLWRSTPGPWCTSNSIGTGCSGRLDDPATTGSYLRPVPARRHVAVRQPAVFLLGHCTAASCPALRLDHPPAAAGAILYLPRRRSPGRGVPEAMHWLNITPRLPAAASRKRPRGRARSPRSGPGSPWTTRRPRPHPREILPAYFADYWTHERDLEPLRAALLRKCGSTRCASEPAPFDVQRGPPLAQGPHADRLPVLVL